MPAPIFAVHCPGCSARVHVRSSIFAKCEWAAVDKPSGAFVAEVPDVEQRVMDALRGFHPMNRGTLPLVDVACPECKGAFSIALAIFVPSPDMTSQTAPDPVADVAPILVDGDA